MNNTDFFGGQSFANFDNVLAKYVGLTRQEIYNEFKSLLGDYESEEEIQYKTKIKLERYVEDAMQAFVNNLNSMHSRGGSQTVFSSVNIGIPIGDEQTKEDSSLICKYLLQEYAKGFKNGAKFLFPNIIFRVKDGINKKEGDPYFNNLKLACKVASTNMNPTFSNMDNSQNIEYFNRGIIPAIMG